MFSRIQDDGHAKDKALASANQEIASMKVELENKRPRFSFEVSPLGIVPGGVGHLVIAPIQIWNTGGPGIVKSFSLKVTGPDRQLVTLEPLKPPVFRVVEAGIDRKELLNDEAGLTSIDKERKAYAIFVLEDSNYRYVTETNEITMIMTLWDHLGSSYSVTNSNRFKRPSVP